MQSHYSKAGSGADNKRNFCYRVTRWDLFEPHELQSTTWQGATKLQYFTIVFCVWLLKELLLNFKTERNLKERVPCKV
jgi:hypothetical protein